MERGVPCISTREGGIGGIIDDGLTGWLVDGQNAQVVAGRVEWMLLHRDECQRMGMAGREKFLAEFTQAKFEARMVEVLSACLSR